MKKYLGVLLLAVTISAGLTAQEPITVMVLWSGTELDAFQRVVDNFVETTGIQVRVESVGRDLPQILVARLEGGNP
ncbi:MAG TPA: carbohydrate ABC transporter substrate-binding protein, partial [Candidatus Acetothermia bacterium]|nr:carbohydrate ABC transporter substrate-binding protein [Candidatus Acetothermia bacterium]